MKDLRRFQIASPPVAPDTLVEWSVLDRYDGIGILTHYRDHQGLDWLREWLDEEWGETHYTRRDLLYTITPPRLVDLTCNRLPLRDAIRIAAQCVVCDEVYHVLEGRVITRKTKTLFYRLDDTETLLGDDLPREGVMLYA